MSQVFYALADVCPNARQMLRLRPRLYGHEREASVAADKARALPGSACILVVAVTVPDEAQLDAYAANAPVAP